MSDDESDPAGREAALLADMKALRRRTRTARHAYWFPLVLFGLLTCASVPFYVMPGPPAGGTGTVPEPPLPILGGFAGVTAQRSLGYYWLAALFGGLLLTLLWYRWNARRVGLSTPARGYLVTTAVLTVLALVVPPLSQVRSPGWLSWLRHLDVLWPGDLVLRGRSRSSSSPPDCGSWPGRNAAAPSLSSPRSTPRPRCWPACTTSRTCCSGSAGILRAATGA